MDSNIYYRREDRKARHIEEALALALLFIFKRTPYVIESSVLVLHTAWYNQLIKYYARAKDMILKQEYQLLRGKVEIPEQFKLETSEEIQARLNQMGVERMRQVLNTLAEKQKKMTVKEFEAYYRTHVKKIVVETEIGMATSKTKYILLTNLIKSGIISTATLKWLTRRDERVRFFHQEAEGQTVSFPEPFVVGEENLRYPRDELGRPDNIVNCRCIFSYAYKTSS